MRLFEAADGYNLGGGRGVAGSRWQKSCQKIRINYDTYKQKFEGGKFGKILSNHCKHRHLTRF